LAAAGGLFVESFSPGEGEAFHFIVMAGLVPAIHVVAASGEKDVDTRHKAGHDEVLLAVFPLKARRT
jgi:hypothetical protein